MNCGLLASLNGPACWITITLFALGPIILGHSGGLHQPQLNQNGPRPRIYAPFCLTNILTSCNCKYSSQTTTHAPLFSPFSGLLNTFLSSYKSSHFLFAASNLNSLQKTSPCSPFTIILNTTFSIKLDRDNFLLWKSQVLPVVQGYDIGGYLIGTNPYPQKYLESQDENGNIVRSINPEFE